MGRAIVEISGDLLVGILTQGWGEGEYIRCMEGLPEDTKLVDVLMEVKGSIDEPYFVLVLFVEHLDLENGQQVTPIMRSDLFETHNVYKVREKKTGFFITKSGIPKTRGDFLDFATARTVADYLGEDKAELVEYKLVEVKSGN